MQKILIVDEHPPSGAYLKLALKAEGYRAARVETLASVPEHVREFQPDLVLIGLGAREEESWMLLWRLKQAHARLPVLAYHASSTEIVQDIKHAVREAFLDVRSKARRRGRPHLGITSDAECARTSQAPL
jgi:DNA-binding response OmpR family regulator